MSIKLSKKHGVNPSLMNCYFCGEAKGVALLGKLPKDQEAPHQAVYDYEPCDKCKSYMEQGIILISVKDYDKDFRTGGWVVCTQTAIERILQKDALEGVLKKRVAFLADTAWDRIGLPR
jgi:hypothetical protein